MDRRVVASGGELEIRYEVVVFTSGGDGGAVISGRVRRTRLGFHGKIPIPRHPPFIFDSVIAFSLVGTYLSTHSTFCKRAISITYNLLSCAPIVIFNGPNTPMSKG